MPKPAKIPMKKGLEPPAVNVAMLANSAVPVIVESPPIAAMTNIMR